MSKGWDMLSLLALDFRAVFAIRFVSLESRCRSLSRFACSGDFGFFPFSDMGVILSS